jgi:hypothetical protein
MKTPKRSAIWKSPAKHDHLRICIAQANKQLKNHSAKASFSFKISVPNLWPSSDTDYVGSPTVSGLGLILLWLRIEDIRRYVSKSKRVFETNVTSVSQNIKRIEIKKDSWKGATQGGRYHQNAKIEKICNEVEAFKIHGNELDREQADEISMV